MINLLLIEKAGRFHNSWIKDSKWPLYNQSKPQELRNFCECDFHSYSGKNLLESHKTDCREISQIAVRVEMYEEEKYKLTFQKHQKQFSA